MKINLKQFLIFIICVILIFIYTYFINGVISDELWCYGFGYNIANGLVPYKDFNMIITPLYAFVISIFIIIFGHHLWVMHIMNSIIVAIMLFIMYDKINKKIFIMAPFTLLFFFPTYNFFCLFLIIILFYVKDNIYIKNKELIIALIVSFIFLTKQTVGFCLVIPMIYYSKNKLKSLISFSIPIIIFLIYLLYNNAIYNFIDYCFLGMFEFSSSNKLYFLLPLEVIILLILVYKNIKCKFSNSSLFYILMFQIITLPIVDIQHFTISFILILYYIFTKINIKKKNIKYYSFILFSTIVIWNILMNNYYSDNNFYGDKSSYLYGRRIEKYIENSITYISNYMEDIKNKYDNIYLITSNAYQIKMNTSYQINKFDLINNGNMGYNGYKKYIKEIDSICKKESCLFIVYKYEIPEDKNKYIQINKNIIYYIYNKYNKQKDEDDFYIYIN